MYTHKENLLEENRGRVLHDTGICIGKKFLHSTPFIQELKTTTDKWDLITLKSLGYKIHSIINARRENEIQDYRHLNVFSTFIDVQIYIIHFIHKVSEINRSKFKNSP